ncbi:MAG: DUF2339 domain-containing protein [Planctomycetota bacterium]
MWIEAVVIVLVVVLAALGMGVVGFSIALRAQLGVGDLRRRMHRLERASVAAVDAPAQGRTVTARAIESVQRARPSTPGEEPVRPEAEEPEPPAVAAREADDTDAADVSSVEVAPASPRSRAPSPAALVDAAYRSRPSEEAAKSEPVAPVAPDASDRPGEGLSLEQRLGGRVLVWVGGIALALAGAFLLKWGYDNVVLSPAQRLGIGAFFGAALLAAGLALKGRAPHVSQASVGAAMAVWYGCIVAATRVFGLIDANAAFGLATAVTAAAVALALRHGPFVAVLGMLGGFAMPAVLGGESESVGPVLAYLLVLEGGLVAVSARRGWVSISSMTMALAVLWAVAAIFLGEGQTDRLFVSGFLIVSTAVYLVQSALTGPRGRAGRRAALLQTGSAAGSAALLTGVLVATGGYTVVDLSMLAVVSAGLLVLGRWRAEYVALPVVAAGVCAAVTLGYHADWAWRAGVAMDSALAWMCVAFGALFGLGGYAASVRSRQRVVFASLSGASGFVFFAIALTRLPIEPFRTGLAVAAVAAVALMVAGSWPWLRRRGVVARRMQSALLLPATGVATLAIGVLLPLEARGLAWAGLGVAIAGLWPWLRTDAMRAGSCVALGLAAFTFSAVLPRFGALEAWPGHTLLPMQLVFGLGALSLTAWLWVRRGEASTAVGVCWAAVVYGVVAAAWLVRYGFVGADWLAEPTLIEASVLALAWLAGGAALRWIGGQRLSGALDSAGQAVVWLALSASCVLGLLALNPLWAGGSVGAWPVANWLALAYGVPAVAAGCVAYVERLRRPVLAQAGGVVSLVMVFVWVSLATRQAFVGGDLRFETHDVGQAESYAYSAVWVGLGLTLLVAGLWRRAAWLRYGSLAVMLIAVGKVFLVDAATLEGLLRVLSFFGLGLSLLALGYVYQRFVLVRKQEPTAGGVGAG